MHYEFLKTQAKLSSHGTLRLCHELILQHTKRILYRQVVLDSKK
jgi:hypothetical protein